MGYHCSRTDYRPVCKLVFKTVIKSPNSNEQCTALLYIGLTPEQTEKGLQRYFEKKCNRVARSGAGWDPIAFPAKVPIGITSN
eukprot:scaffold8635_cov32-Phaeocystis_antarctica.AAC.1